MGAHFNIINKNISSMYISITNYQVSKRFIFYYQYKLKIQPFPNFFKDLKWLQGGVRVTANVGLMCLK